MRNEISSKFCDEKNVFMRFSSRELFKLRGVCTDWSDSVKTIWCQVVKNEMLEQAHSLDLLYEKETTSNLLEFKLKYLVSYATLMTNYFVHINLEDIIADLVSLEDKRGRYLILIATNIVGPKIMVRNIYFLLIFLGVSKNYRRNNRRSLESIAIIHAL